MMPLAMFVRVLWGCALTFGALCFMVFPHAAVPVKSTWVAVRWPCKQSPPTGGRGWGAAPASLASTAVSLTRALTPTTSTPAGDDVFIEMEAAAMCPG